MLGVAVFSVLGAFAFLLAGVLYAIGRFALPDWAVPFLLVAVWLLWAGALTWAGRAWLVP